MSQERARLMRQYVTERIREYTAATLLLHMPGAPMPDFSAGTSREEILSALRATP